MTRDMDTVKMSHEEMIDTLKGLVFGTFDRTTAKEREALDMVIKLQTEPSADVIPIPRGATNGDIIKAMFPNVEFNNAMPFTDGRWEIMNLDTENRLRAIYKPTQLRTYADWWDAPYKRN